MALDRTPVPGLYEDVPEAEYHSQWHGFSQSAARTILNHSPAHLHAAITGSPRKETPALVFGKVVHLAVLQPDAFALGEKELRAALRADYRAHLDPIVEAVRSHKAASAALDGKSEVSMVWRDDETGVICKGRADSFNYWARCIVDLKTAASAAPFEFAQSVARYGYHLQAAHYLAGAKALEQDIASFIFVVVEKTPPYAVACYTLDPHALKVGERKLNAAKRTYADCILNNRWYGFPPDVRRLSLPRWAT